MNFHGEITPAAEEDIPALAAIEEACFSRPWSRESLEGELASESSLLLAARLEGQVIGYAGLQTVLDEGYITNVSVLPQFRRRGAARALIKALIREGERRPLSFLTLEVRVSNTPAINLYRQCGFAEAGRRRDYYDAPREDAYILTRFYTTDGGQT